MGALGRGFYHDGQMSVKAEAIRVGIIVQLGYIKLQVGQRDPR